MEYEIEDRPQMGEEEHNDAVERPDLNRVSPPLPRTPKADQRDRAVAIPDQEAGS